MGWDGTEKYVPWTSLSDEEMRKTLVTTKGLRGRRVYISIKFKTDKHKVKNERYQHKVEVNGFDGLVIKQLMDFIYSGSIMIDTNDCYRLALPVTWGPRGAPGLSPS